MEPTAESDVLCDDPLVGHVWKPLKVERTKTGYETTQVCARCRASRLLDEQGQEISVTPPELCGCPAWMAPKHLPSCKTRVTSPGHGVEDVDAFLTAYDNQPGIETTVLPPEGGKA